MPNAPTLDQQRKVLALIVERSPAAAGDAARLLHVTDRAAIQRRLNRIAPKAMADQAAGWTPEEREYLLGAIGGETTQLLNVRMDDEEKSRLRQYAAARGISMSDLVRERLADIIS